jgi:hypothetical protein
MSSVDGLDPVQRPLRDELTEAIARVRGGKGAGAMADELLKRDKQSHQLVGVIEEGVKAVFYEPPRWGVMAVPFDESGVDGLDSSQMDRLKRRATVERFVREQGAEFWTWVHPRYRWVFDSEK